MTLHVDRIDLADAVRTGVNPYLVGPYAPTHDELTLTGLEVVGRDPGRSERRLRAQRPNPQHEPNGRYHWFDGDAMVHSVHIADGQATYRNRWVRTDGFEREREAGAPLWKGIIESSGANPPGEPEKDTANTDLVFHNEKLLALWYRAGKPYALDPLTLDTLGAEDFDGTLRCEVSAHAKADERTGELMFFDYGVKPPYMRYGVGLPRGRRASLRRHRPPGPAPAARHGDHRAPLDPDGPAALQRPRGRAPRALQALLRPRHAEPLRRHSSLRERSRGALVRGRAVLHLPLGERAGGGGRDRARRLPREAARAAHGPRGAARERALLLRLDAHMHRYRFNLRTGRTTERTIDDDNSEFPSINNNVLGRRRRGGPTRCTSRRRPPCCSTA